MDLLKIPGFWRNWCLVIPTLEPFRCWNSGPSPCSLSGALSESSLGSWGQLFPSERLLRQPVLGRVLLVPDFLCSRVMEANLLLGTFSAAELFLDFTSSDLCLEIILSLGPGASSSDLKVWFLLWYCQLRASLVCFSKSNPVSGFDSRWKMKVQQHLKDKRKQTPEDRQKCLRKIFTFSFFKTCLHFCTFFPQNLNKVRTVWWDFKEKKILLKSIVKWWWAVMVLCRKVHFYIPLDTGHHPVSLAESFTMYRRELLCVPFQQLRGFAVAFCL